MRQQSGISFRSDLCAGSYKPVTLPGSASTPGVRLGRNASDGYVRGVGLEYGDLSAQIEADPLYQHATELSVARTIVMPKKRQNIFLLLTHFIGQLSSHNIIEFGSYKGGCAIFMAIILKHLYPEAKVYALDTFEGMPETNMDIDICTKSMFTDTSVESIQDYANIIGLDNLVLVKGLFQETLPNLLQDGKKFALAHIDADIYSACKFAQNEILPSMSVGGYLVYDDATDSACIGALQSIEDLVLERGMRAEQINPHYVFRAGLTNADTV